MPQTLTLEDAQQSLRSHLTAKGAEIREKYGPSIGWQQLQRILADPTCVRYPCELVFDATPLQTDEIAYPQPKGDRPEDGFSLCVHPYFSLDPARVPLIALYQLVAINYGAFASPEDAEAFGAAVLGLPPEEYYAALCALADEISSGQLTGDEPAASGCHCGGSGGSCGSSPGTPPIDSAAHWPRNAQPRSAETGTIGPKDT